LTKEELISNFLLELRRGTVILCVLAKLQTPTYGYALIGVLAASGIPIETNTLYPLLRRLEAQGLLASSWNVQDSPQPRKYYVTTAFGREVLQDMKQQWQATANSLNNILKESEQ